MIDKLFIEKNSNQIIEYLNELELIVNKSDDEIKSNSLLYHTAERLLQLIVDSMIDINIHLIKEGKLNVPDDLQSTFLTLANNKIIPSEFADKIAP
ncbi:MAG TPA: HepT-like ribonuclease domain-containing protein, partial [Patescibacteria group bacterium]|nr:HepT-like ribonuclease domain-containing protein [Patescibacteria group bacterium]